MNNKIKIIMGNGELSKEDYVDYGSGDVIIGEK